MPFPMLKQYLAVECDVIISVRGAGLFFAPNPLLMAARLINRPHSGAAASIALAARRPFHGLHTTHRKYVVALPYRVLSLCSDDSRRTFIQTSEASVLHSGTCHCKMATLIKSSLYKVNVQYREARLLVPWLIVQPSLLFKIGREWNGLSFHEVKLLG